MIIAQISDIHAGPDNSNLSRFDSALKWLDAVEPDALVLTGDLIDNSWFEGYESIYSRLDIRRFPTFILPGNADNKSLMRSVWGERFWSVTPFAEGLHIVADMGELRLIGLDSTIQGSSEGAVGNHLAWLEKSLSYEDDAPSMLFLHHHIIQSGIPAMDHIMCKDHAQLGELLQNSSRQPIAIATGHVHRPIAGFFSGIPAYICGSICPANPLWFGTEIVPPVNDPPSLMIHRFINHALVSHHVSI